MTAVHPLIVYWHDSRSEEPSDLRRETYVMISDSLCHGNATMHAFQQHFLHTVTAEHSNVTKFSYLTDGAASQYKN